MYGLITSMLVLPKNRDSLLRTLSTGSTNLPGCVSYVVAADAEDTSVVWVTEVWASAAAHTASLELAEVKEAMAEARPLVVGFGKRVTTAPTSVA